MESPMKRVPGVVAETLAAGIMDQSPFAEGAEIPSGTIPFRAGPFNPWEERFDEVVKQEAGAEATGWAVKLELTDAEAVLQGSGLTGGKMDVKRMVEGVVVKAVFKF